MSLRTRIVLLTLVLAAPLMTLASAPAAASPIGWQASGGWYTESDVFFLGGGARLGLGTITIIPNGEWLFADRGSAFTINVDGTLSVVPLAVANIYAGLGLGLFTVNPSGSNSHTDTVVNLIAGAGFNALPLSPFAQFKWVIVDGNDPLVFSIGTRF